MLKIITNLIFYIIISLLVAIPAGFFYLGYKTKKFMDAHPDGYSGYAGMVLAFLFYAEIWLGLIFLWIYAIRNSEINSVLKIIQLIIIIIIGIVPAFLLVLTAFLK